jgi:heme-degrading monooxygenase HmoA
MNASDFKPYYAVIFTSRLEQDHPGYEDMSDRMIQLAAEQEGFLGYESARESLGITISYWSSLDAILKWKKNEEHLAAQRKGISDWYSYYKLRICKVEREYEFTRNT